MAERPVPNGGFFHRCTDVQMAMEEGPAMEGRGGTAILGSTVEVPIKPWPLFGIHTWDQ